MDDEAPYINRVNAADLPMIEARNERLALEREILRLKVSRTRWIVFCVVLFLVWLGWFFRWNVETVARGDGAPTAYLLDRISGQLFVVIREEKTPVSLSAP